ncbi:peptidoglycan/xylan/chitin deacetylase (PgdA/CDA1 family) [Paenibacillus shirakamiensis]|uniref:Peptidoglycan/xylan/chitin deacetylase (PgdA/CDA1 family) n=1 Tax=Paenibacillus shirakamiensis TaxID=1265935 RepID=A0ABS4JE05_9BACL|nr:peptidoglycan/xylan/chitin deacetylase (PgdA/CDA1 family) [Paenibacillus shirakamiensis]
MNTIPIIRHVDTDEQVVALTFDDGPHEQFTTQILDLFREHDAKGTFFVLGTHVEQYQDLTRQLLQEGHEIGNHTVTHPRLSQLDELATRQELEQAEKIIYDVTEYRPTLFRPPYESYIPMTVHVAREAGYTFVLWTGGKNTLDFSKPGVTDIVERALKDLKHGDIILMHDSSEEPECDRQQTIDALKIILPELKKRGIRCVTISELLSKAR